MTMARTMASAEASVEETMRGHRERVAAATREDSIQQSRKMALEIGSELTPPVDRASPAAVFRSSEPVRGWLLDGPGTDEDRYCRRRAAQIHLGNLRAAATANRNITVHATSPETFIHGAQQYYDQIVDGQY